MSLDKNFKDWQAFSRIVEVMSFIDRLPDLSPAEVRSTAEKLCELPADPQHTMSLEEVIFWAGVATGMDVCRNADQELMDEATADKFNVYASLFAYSTRNAVVDLALQQLEPSNQ
ncbi:MAG TPA: hypothetical protein VFB28_06430 [Terriglobales bacterium]|nr:hypothetical protein [Terriglobales bacterium]